MILSIQQWALLQVSSTIESDPGSAYVTENVILASYYQGDQRSGSTAKSHYMNCNDRK